MSLRKLFARTKAPAADKPPANADQAAELARQQRAAEAARKEAQKALAEAEAAKKAQAQAVDEANRVRVESAITGAAAKARALNPGHVAALLGGKVKVGEGGKLSVDGSDKDLDAYVTEWLSGEGKHFLPAAVPGGGSGAPASPASPPQVKTYDLKTAEGMTAYARDREAAAHRPGMAPRQAPAQQAPSAPQQAAQPPAGGAQTK